MPHQRKGAMEPDEYARMDAVEGKMWWYRALHARLLDALEASTSPVLDAGCGTGGFLAVLNHVRPTQAAVGLEWHAEAAALAAGKSGLPIARGSINELPFAASTFGTGIAADLLCSAAGRPTTPFTQIPRRLPPN